MMIELCFSTIRLHYFSSLDCFSFLFLFQQVFIYLFFFLAILINIYIYIFLLFSEPRYKKIINEIKERKKKRNKCHSVSQSILLEIRFGVLNAYIYIYVWVLDTLSDDRLDKPLPPSEKSHEESKAKTTERCRSETLR